MAGEFKKFAKRIGEVLIPPGSDSSDEKYQHFISSDFIVSSDIDELTNSARQVNSQGSTEMRTIQRNTTPSQRPHIAVPQYNVLDDEADTPSPAGSYKAEIKIPTAGFGLDSNLTVEREALKTANSTSAEGLFGDDDKSPKKLPKPNIYLTKSDIIEPGLSLSPELETTFRQPVESTQTTSFVDSAKVTAQPVNNAQYQTAPLDFSEPLLPETPCKKPIVDMFKSKIFLERRKGVFYYRCPGRAITTAFIFLFWVGVFIYIPASVPKCELALCENEPVKAEGWNMCMRELSNKGYPCFKVQGDKCPELQCPSELAYFFIKLLESIPVFFTFVTILGCASKLIADHDRLVDLDP